MRCATAGRLTALMALTALGGLLTGCAVGVQAHPVVVGHPATVRGLPDGPAPPSTSVQTFFVRGGRLVPVVRQVAVGPGLAPCLSALVLPLSAKESSDGLRSALPTGVTLLQGAIEGSVAAVTVPPGFDRLTVSDQILAAAQVVYTVTANSYLTRVEMVQKGRLLSMPDESGQLVSRPLSRHDYASLAPR
ncbi:MAG TPA: GerMN domain-containing protein [Actinomycetales bacterium]|nr:GerMN domain-containing protein [Actinomycetales bacterium]